MRLRLYHRNAADENDSVGRHKHQCFRFVLEFVTVPGHFGGENRWKTGVSCSRGRVSECSHPVDIKFVSPKIRALTLTTRRSSITKKAHADFACSWVFSWAFIGVVGPWLCDAGGRGGVSAKEAFRKIRDEVREACRGTIICRFSSASFPVFVLNHHCRLELTSKTTSIRTGQRKKTFMHRKHIVILYGNENCSKTSRPVYNQRQLVHEPSGYILFADQQ